MHVPSYPRVVAWLLMLASFAGVRPGRGVRRKDSRRPWSGMRCRAENAGRELFAQASRALQTASPAEMVIEQGALAANVSISMWQLTRALEDERPLEDLSALGLVKHEDGIPHRLQRVSAVAAVSRKARLADAAPEHGRPRGRSSSARGFRESDVAALRNYVETHDLKAAASARTLPIAISFSKVVKKYDKIKRPVDNDLVFSYIYQREKARGGSAARMDRRAHPQSRRSARARASCPTSRRYRAPATGRPTMHEAGVDEPVGRHAASGLRTTSQRPKRQE